MVAAIPMKEAALTGAVANRAGAILALKAVPTRRQILLQMATPVKKYPIPAFPEKRLLP